MFANNYMKSALAIARKQSGEVPIGAIIVDPTSNKIVAQANNNVEKLNNPLAHAEILAIEKACRILETKTLKNYDLYVTLQPCPMCMHAILLSKISRLYFGAYDIKTPLNLYPSNHQLEIYGGIHEDKCKELLNNFFAQKRN